MALLVSRTTWRRGLYLEETASRVRGVRAWVTNEYERNGLRADGDRVLGRLIDMARGRA